MTNEYHNVAGTPPFKPFMIITPLICYWSFESILKIIRYGASFGLDDFEENGNLVMKNNPDIEIWLENGVIRGRGKGNHND
jgi:hypothetical protein